MSEQDPFPTIHPTTVLMLPHLEALGLTERIVRQERLAGRLRVARRAKRLYVLGAWFLEWVAAGEVKTSATPEPAAHEQLHRPGGPAGPLTNGKHARGAK